jgi:CRP/FNR family nitrogen fixation transcriptional regulator
MHTALATSRPLSEQAIVAPVRARPGAREDALVGLTRSFTKDDEIFAQGDGATHFYRVVSGVVRTSKLLSDGRRQIDAFHLAGDVFGLERGEEHRFTAEAVADCVVVAFRRCGVAALMSSDSQLAQQVVTAMMRSLERAQDHMMLLGRKTALEKIASFLLDMANRVSKSDGQIDLPMTRMDIADHLGLTIETVSRTLTQLERERVIELPAARRTIVLRDKAALRRLDS